MKKSLLTVVVCLLLIACRRPLPTPTPEEEDLIGTWRSLYEYLPDGTKDSSNVPYALLEFEYSDGFILKEDDLCDVVWLGLVNAPDLTWTLKEETLRIHDTDFTISDRTANQMDFATPKGHKYRLEKR